MYVKDKMTRNPYSVEEDTSISDVLDIMQSHGLHRIPVVDSQNHLKGLVTKTTIQRHSPTEASSLSIYEINYLFTKMTVKDVMIKEVRTIGPDALLEEAASKMRLYNIGCLPVMEDDRLIGIITHNDVFDAFIDLLGYNQTGSRYVINVTDERTGQLAEIAECFRKCDIFVSNLAVYHTVRGVEVVVIAVGDNSSDCGDALKEAGYNVTSLASLRK